MTPHKQRGIGTFVALLHVLVLALLSPSAQAIPQEQIDDLMDLDIEELMGITIPTLSNVLGGHVHNKGEWMPMLYHMNMRMKGLRDGTDDIDIADVLTPGGTYMVAPEKMDMSMTMLGAMYGISDNFTLMGMMPYHRRSMDLRMAAGAEFTTKSEGVGDIKMTALYVGWEDYDKRLIWSGGISLPTGSINKRDDTPMAVDMLLPYPMQLGSGTFDLAGGVTFAAEYESWDYGVMGEVTTRIGRNDRGYSLGEKLEAKAWGQHMLTESIGVSGQLKGLSWGSIDGADSELVPGMVPMADASLQGGSRVDLSAGLNFHSSSGSLQGHRFGFEIGTPVYEDLDGPQMSTDWWVTLSWTVSL